MDWDLAPSDLFNTDDGSPSRGKLSYFEKCKRAICGLKRAYVGVRYDSIVEFAKAEALVEFLTGYNVRAYYLMRKDNPLREFALMEVARGSGRLCSREEVEVAFDAAVDFQGALLGTSVTSCASIGRWLAAGKPGTFLDWIREDPLVACPSEETMRITFWPELEGE